MPNNLSQETSPYLLQHKDNPVEWFAWNDESLKKAKDENKPIFLSVGYSSCPVSYTHLTLPTILLV